MKRRCSFVGRLFLAAFVVLPVGACGSTSESGPSSTAVASSSTQLTTTAAVTSLATTLPASTTAAVTSLATTLPASTAPAAWPSLPVLAADDPRVFSPEVVPAVKSHPKELFIAELPRLWTLGISAAGSVVIVEQMDDQSVTTLTAFDLSGKQAWQLELSSAGPATVHAGRFLILDRPRGSDAKPDLVVVNPGTGVLERRIETTRHYSQFVAVGGELFLLDRSSSSAGIARWDAGNGELSNAVDLSSADYVALLGQGLLVWNEVGVSSIALPSGTVTTWPVGGPGYEHETEITAAGNVLVTLDRADSSALVVYRASGESMQVQSPVGPVNSLWTFDGRYLLIGGEQGLATMDLSDPRALPIEMRQGPNRIIAHAVVAGKFYAVACGPSECVLVGVGPGPILDLATFPLPSRSQVMFSTDALYVEGRTARGAAEDAPAVLTLTAYGLDGSGSRWRTTSREFPGLDGYFGAGDSKLWVVYGGFLAGGVGVYG